MKMEELGEEMRKAVEISCGIVLNGEGFPSGIFVDEHDIKTIAPEIIHMAQTLFNTYARGISYSQWTQKGTTYKRGSKTKKLPAEPKNDLETSAVVSVLNAILKDNPDEFNEWETKFLKDMAERIKKNWAVTPKQKEKVDKIFERSVSKGLTEDYQERWEL
jgi:hypothetical protein